MVDFSLNKIKPITKEHSNLRQKKMKDFLGKTHKSTECQNMPPCSATVLFRSLDTQD